MRAAWRNVLSPACGPVRNSRRNFSSQNLARIFSSGSQNLQKFSGKFLVRGGKNRTNDGINSPRIVVVEFANYKDATECYDSKEYQKGWSLAKKTTTRHMQVIEGFSIE